jgi:predicted 3-demethylubiquinone-9 3-methyltransferase (glyoxalase superfamily)
MKKITPFLWFHSQALEAAKFYVSIFKKDSKVTGVSYHLGTKKKSVFSVRFRLRGQDFMALNGGPHFSFTPAVSLYVDCEDQKEVDRLWKKLLAGGRPSRCGWLEDRYGLSWQIIPRALPRLLGQKDKKKAAAAMAAMMTMVKIDVKKLRQAAGSSTLHRKL